MYYCSPHLSSRCMVGCHTTEAREAVCCESTTALPARCGPVVCAPERGGPLRGAPIKKTSSYFLCVSALLRAHPCLSVKFGRHASSSHRPSAT